MWSTLQFPFFISTYFPGYFFFFFFFQAYIGQFFVAMYIRLVVQGNCNVDVAIDHSALD